MTQTIEAQVKSLVAFKDEIVPGAVKAAMKDSDAKSSDLWRVPVSQIKIRPGYNPRIDTPDYRDGLERLADSIEANGFYDDKAIACVVVAENGKNVLYVEDGHRRFAATGIAISRGAEITTLPVVVLSRSMSAEQRLVHMVKSNNEGEKFKPLELAIIVQRLAAFGHDEQLIAKELGMTTTYVKQLTTLASSPKDIRDMVTSGEISATLAIETLQEHKEQAAPLLKEASKTAKASNKKLTAKTVKKVVAAKKKPPTKTEMAEKSVRLQKKNGVEAFDLLMRIMNKHGKVIDDNFHSEVDALFVKCGVIG